MILQRHGFDYSFKHVLLEDLDIFGVTLSRVEHLVLLLHHLTNIEKRAQFQLRI